MPTVPDNKRRKDEIVTGLVSDTSRHVREIFPASREIENVDDADDSVSSWDSPNLDAEIGNTGRLARLDERHPYVPVHILTPIQEFLSHDIAPLIAVEVARCEEVNANFQRIADRLSKLSDDLTSLADVACDSVTCRHNLKESIAEASRKIRGHRVLSFSWGLVSFLVSAGDMALFDMTYISRDTERAGINVTLTCGVMAFASMSLLGLLMHFAVVKPYHMHKDNEEITTVDWFVSIGASVLLMASSVTFGLMRVGAFSSGTLLDIGIAMVLILILWTIALAGASSLRIALLHEQQRKLSSVDLASIRPTARRVKFADVEKARIEKEITQLQLQRTALIKVRKAIIDRAVDNVLKQPEVLQLIDVTATQIAAIEAEFNTSRGSTGPGNRPADRRGKDADAGSQNPLRDVGRNGRGTATDRPDDPGRGANYGGGN